MAMAPSSRQKNVLMFGGLVCLCIITFMSIELSTDITKETGTTTTSAQVERQTLAALDTTKPKTESAVSASSGIAEKSSTSATAKAAADTTAAVETAVPAATPVSSTDTFPTVPYTPFDLDTIPKFAATSTFLERLNTLLPPTCKSLLEEHRASHPNCIDDTQDRRLFPDDVAKLEKVILQFNIPRETIVDFVDSEYLSLIHWRWKFVIDGRRPVDEQQCPRCTVRHTTTNAGMNATSIAEIKARPGDIKVHDGCPYSMPDNFKDHEHQTTAAGCGESQVGSGSGYATSGRKQFDHDTSFEHTNKLFHRTYAHLHLSPPEPKYANLTELFSVTDMARALLRDPPLHRIGDDRNEVAMFTHSNCAHERGSIVTDIIRSDTVTIARYGQCFHNRDSQEFLPPEFYYGDNEGTRDSTKTILSSNHKFTFSLENTLSRDYFTEKRYQALLGASVPIVWGNDNSLDFLPDPDAAFIIDPANYQGQGAVIGKRLTDLANNPTEYAKFFAWKRRGLRASFVRKLFLSTDFVACRMCEYMALQHATSKTRPNEVQANIVV